jgi:hypothetical protein
VVIVVEVVHALTVLKAHEVYVLNLGGPLEVVVRGPHILILRPSPVQQRPSQLSVTSLDDEYFLVVAHSVPAFPGAIVHTGLLLFLLLLVDRFI